MQSKVRSACEECHERKIRCLLPSEGGACQACLTSKRQCYFLPRHKAGRPRRGNRPLSSLPASRHTTPAPIPCLSPRSDGANAERNRARNEAAPENTWQLEGATLPGSFLGNGTSSDGLTMPSDLHAFPSPPISQFPMLPDYFSMDESIGVRAISQSTDPSDSSLSSPARVVSPLVHGHEGSRFPRIVSPMWPEMSVPQAGDTESVGLDRWKNSSVSFATLLEKCSELDCASKVLKERDQRTGIHLHLPPILRAIDALCDQCAAFIHEHPAPCPKESLDPAVLALVIAANFKVLEVCALLVSLSVSNVQRPHDQLLLKRIDFNLTQTKIALVAMKEQEMTSPSVFQTALDQGVRIHQQIVLMTES
ncbi:uncharacterized protein N7496_010898 [Penicillium cataractarum]|uniref:Zn(2)-C6 fungal-type domain-containing protein n=1 Tax=Penicillium cataractarum TaxID=2100454 RepID=A0A9W9RF86_9EURO|nr:uncharacterized protein N7496_010898 [Penicillium cataractarum]KAJ5358485.1 hypothetical protein N7496_010898 [Penicillium cataractarum]